MKFGNRQNRRRVD